MGEVLGVITMEESAGSYSGYNDTITPWVMGVRGQKVLDSLGVSREDFKQSLTYYEENPADFAVVFDSAVAYINRLKETDLKRKGEY